MAINKRQQRGEITIRMTVVLVFILATSLTAGVAISLQYYFGRMLAGEAASDLYTTASDSVASNWQSLTTQTNNVVTLISQNGQLADSQLDGKELEMIAGVMRRNPLFYGIYLGHPDGTFLELVNLDAAKTARSKLLAVPDDKWLIIEIRGEGSERRRTFRYLNSNFQQRVERSEVTDFDPRERPWYNEALANPQGYTSDPYLFAQLGQPGRTISAQVMDSDTVVGFDMLLESISDFLRSQDVASEGELFVYKREGEIMASSAEVTGGLAGIPPLNFALTDEEKEYIDSLGTLSIANELDWPPIDYAIRGEPYGYSPDVIRLVADALGLDIEFVNGMSWAELTQAFNRGELDILQPVILTENNEDWGLASRAIMELPFALATREGSIGLDQLTKLSGKRLAIPAGWSINPVVRAAFPEILVVEPTTTLGALQMVLQGEADAALDNEAIMKYIAEHYYLEGLEYHGSLDFGATRVPKTLHMMLGNDQQQLVDILNRAIASITPEQRAALSAKWLQAGETRDAATANTVPDPLFIKVAEDTSLQGKLLGLNYEGDRYFAYVEPITRGDNSLLYLGLLVPEETVVGPFMEKVLLSITITAGFLLVMMPLSWAFANPIVKPIRQLTIENDKVRRREYDSVVKIDSHVKEIHELSDSMVTMVEAIKAHEIAQRDLMDAFIRLIAAAIDEKSPYTGGHCERVPELAMMLAKHASSSTSGPFSDFKLDSEEQWREYRIAAWLHDCGKITTPEHIVDKGSKLETIYNRVHEIRMRFEVLWRDAEIHYLTSLRKQPSEESSLLQELESERERLRDEYAFIAECNVGGEYLSPEKQERLMEIAGRTWTRHFDDRIGLSPVEELRVASEPAVPVPAQEPLLADKTQHIIERSRPAEYPPEYGINMDIPENLYNLGEIYNLSISRGTLTAEDRFKINEHMISTIKMLESLPFPAELQNVPRWASTHHETMRGSGYPRKLPGEALSIPERIMAVADVFEALTAADRPYKKAKPVSVAIDILSKMVEDKHIDRDCFNLFLREKVYEEYARRYLDPSQIDEVDIDKYLTAA